jgi:hypothetical protein
MTLAQIAGAAIGGAAALALLLALGTLCFVKRRRRSAQKRERQLSGRDSDKIAVVGGADANGHGQRPLIAEAGTSAAWGLVGWEGGKGSEPHGRSNNDDMNGKAAQHMPAARFSAQELAADERRWRASGQAAGESDAPAPTQPQWPLCSAGATLPAAQTQADPVEMSA